LSSVADVTSIPQINNKHISPFEVPSPSRPEQRAIAEALSDVDGLLGALEALIAKKRAIKQAAMQQLLTGKTRLPGFSGPWETKRLGEIAELHRQNVVPAAIGGELFTHFSLPAFDDGQIPVTEPGTAIGSNKFRVPDSAVLVSKLNPRIPRVWMPHGGVPNTVASTEFLVLTPRQRTSRLFLFVLCSSPEFCERLELSATGTTGSHQRVNPSDAIKISLRVPPEADEQTAIATVLFDMDAEIAALERRRDKTRAIKQGMMQQLLTGRVRLVKPEAAA
jgi:type I restriction enzyme S subunit